GEAGVDHETDSGNRQRSLGDVRREDDAAFPAHGMEDRRLLRGGEAGVERQDEGVAVVAALQQIRRLADLAFAGEEDEGVAEAVDLSERLEGAADLFGEGFV